MQTDGVVVVNVTGNPDEAVALTVNGDSIAVRSASGAKVIVWLAFVTVKFRSTDAAGAYTVSPGWLACTLHVPAATSAMSEPSAPLDVHTAGVVVVNVTGNPDDAVALTVNGDCDASRVASVPKVMLCGARVTLKLRTTGAAALNVASPAWSASTVHVPTATSAIVAPFAPPAVQIAGVVVVKVTGSNDVEIAVTVTGDCATDLSANVPNVMACELFEMMKLCETCGAAS